MDWLHRFWFSHGLGAKLLVRCLPWIKRHSVFDRLLERIERALKGPLFGCESCGMCRLAATQFVCPETCPKGLANGACGGTTENRCEFGDRDCIHSMKYRIAKDADVLHELESWLIPAVPPELRHTSSWPPHFRGEGPRIVTLENGRANAQTPASRPGTT
jgi:methylenetetrahydrofolate reductase (NADPH)